MNKNNSRSFSLPMRIVATKLLKNYETGTKLNRTSSVNKIYIIMRVRSAFSLVASCVLLKCTRMDDVN